MNLKKYAKSDSRFIGASDVDEIGGSVIYTIRDVTEEEMRDGRMKGVIWFKETSKGMVLNKTNAVKLTEGYGEESEDLINRQIKISATDVQFSGETVRGMRIQCRKPDSGTVAPTAGQPSADPTALAPIPPPPVDEPPPPGDDFQPAEDDLPF